MYAVLAFLERRQIGQHQLGVDDFNVADWIDFARDVMNVATFKTTDDFHDRVHFANMIKELIAESFTRAGAFDQTGDIDKLNRRRRDLLRMRHLGEFRQTRIRHGNDAEVGLDRAKRIIFRRRLVRAGDCIKQCGLANVRQTYDSCAQHKRGRYRVTSLIAIDCASIFRRARAPARNRTGIDHEHEHEHE